MFGYVRAYKPEMTFGDFEIYQGVYCSLCKRLGKRYGPLARMTLSYDFTFLALFRMAAADSCPHFEVRRCALHPLKKRACCCGDADMAFAADAAMLLTWYKLQDNAADRGRMKRLAARFLLFLFRGAHQKAAEALPEMDAHIARCMEQQARVEAEKTSGIDAAADPSAQMLSYIAQAGARDERERRVLERFGYCLGRWIYLIDAVDDMPDDLESGDYNAYILARGIQPQETQRVAAEQKQALLTLNACLAECIAAYNLLTIRRFDRLLRNILEQGMPVAQNRILLPRKERRRSARKAGVTR